MNSLLNNLISVAIRMLESSSRGNDSNELDYNLCKLNELVPLICKDSLLEEVLDLLWMPAISCIRIPENAPILYTGL